MRRRRAWRRTRGSVVVPPTPAFSPSSLPLTFWLPRGGYSAPAGAGTWASSASAGTSGDKGSVTQATTADAPAVGTGGLAVFDGVSDTLAGAHAMNTLVGAAAWTVVVEFEVPSTVADGPIYNDKTILTDSGGASFFVTVSAAGFKAGHYDGAAYRNAVKSCSVGERHLGIAWFDGTNITVEVDGVAGTPVAAAHGVISGGLLKLGTNYTGASFFNGTTAELMLADVVLTAEQRADLYTRFRAANSAAATALYTSGVQMRGVNRAGAEYGNDWGGWTGQTFFTWPTTAKWAAELTYLANEGYNTVRIPISWERLQHDLLGAFSPTYQASMTSMVTQATDANFRVVLDLHNYNRFATGTHTTATGDTQQAGYVQQVFGDGVLTNAHVIDVWEKLADLFKANDKVSFNLMNEPHDFAVTSDNYVTAINAQIAAIRAKGATNLILVPNSRGSDVDHWEEYSPNGGALDSVAFLNIVDSGNNFAFDMHAYWVPGSTPARYTSYANLLAEVTTWAQTNGKKLFLSEMGADPALADDLTQIADAIAFMNTNSDAWIGWTPWNLSPYAVTDSTYEADGAQASAYTATLTPNIVSA